MATHRNTSRISSSMMNDPFFAEASVPKPWENDGLDEGELLLEDDEDDGGFEEEATAVFNPDQHGAYSAPAAPARGGWSAPAPADDPWGETELEEIVEEYADESTRVWDGDEPVAPAWQTGRSVTASTLPHGQPPAAFAAPPTVGRRAATMPLPRAVEEIPRQPAQAPPRRTAQAPAVNATQSIPRAPGAVPRQQLSATRPAHSTGAPPVARQQVVPMRTSEPSGPVIPVPTAPSGLTPVQTGLLAVIALLLVGVILLVLKPFGGAPDPTPVTTTLALFTTPTGASVEIDGVRRADTTPTIVPDLEVGRSYSITLSLDGHEPLQQTILIDSSDPRQETLTLRQLTGSVAVISVPDGAAVALNGEPRGTSPVTIEGLDMSRAYVITATREGYQTASQQLRWEENSPRDQAIALTLQAEPGRVAEAPAAAPEPVAVAEPEPPAPVEVARAQEPARAPAAARTEPVRTTSAPAPRPTTASAPTPRPTATRPSNLQPDPEPVRPSERTVAAQPTRPSDRAAAQQAPVRPSERAQQAPARPSERAEAPARPSDRAARPERPARGESASAGGDMGSLSVQAVPYGQVWINGRMVANETPLINHRLPAGAHRVKVYFVPLRSFSDERTIRIEAGASESVTFRAPR